MGVVQVVVEFKTDSKYRIRNVVLSFPYLKECLAKVPT